MSTQLNKIIALSITAASFLAIFVCIICDLVIFGRLTWSSITTSAILFTYATLLPLLTFGKRGIGRSLAVFSILLIPFLYTLSIAIQEANIFHIGLPLAIIAIIYFWCIFGIFQLTKSNILRFIAFVLLLSIPASLVVNLTLSHLLAEPWFDIWDIISILILLIVAGILLIRDYLQKKPQCK